MLLDIKSGDPDTYRSVTGEELAPTLRFAERLAAMGKPVWIRFVLVPGLTDDPANIESRRAHSSRRWRTSNGWRCCRSTRWARSNGSRLGWSIGWPTHQRPTPQQVRAALEIFRECRLPRALMNRTRRNVIDVDVISDLIGAQPILALFLAIGLGYAVGQINILGFSLGIGAVLFVGLVIGAIAPKAQIAGPIGLIGLIMFLYGIGILYGRQFFEGLTGPGRKYNLLALVAVVAGLLVALGLGRHSACRSATRSASSPGR